MIRFDNLRAGYDGVERLHGVSCSIPAGALTALIGPNGCGKTTLLKCAAGLLNPAEGRVLLGSQPVNALSRRELARRVAYMPQSRPVPELTVAQLAAHGRYPHLPAWGRGPDASDLEIVRRAMDRADVAIHAHRPVSRLSGGERQRAYLAMMLAQESPVMLLDEPTNCLDPGGQLRLMSLLRSLSREGHTVVAVLHDLSLALEYADHVLLMQRGTLVRQGTPEGVLDSGALDDVFSIRSARTPDGKYVFYEGAGPRTSAESAASQA